MNDAVNAGLRTTGPTIPILLTVLLFSAPQIAFAETDEDEPAANEEIETEEPVTWEFSARLRPRLEGRFNHHFGLEFGELNYPTAYNNSDAFTQQSRLGVIAERGDLSGHFMLQHSAVWGSFGGSSLTQPPLSIYEARLRYQAHDMVYIDAGRFELAYGDQRVLGSVGWSQIGRTWDGLRVGVEPIDALVVDVFGARHATDPEGFLEGDSYLTGLYATMSEPVPMVIDEIDLYLLYDLQWGEQGVQDRRQITMAGSRISTEFQDADATIEGGYQFGMACAVADDIDGCAGPRADIRAFFFDVEAGYTIAGFRPYAGFSLASGDDPDSDVIGAYDQFYPTAHAYMGYMDLIGPRTNIREARGGVSWANDWFRQEFNFHDFTRLQPETERVGQEFNTKLYIDLADSFTAVAGHGVFVPDGGISNTDESPEGVANWTFVQLVGAF